jgi:SAM-dependent methyltransferase
MSAEPFQESRELSHTCPGCGSKGLRLFYQVGNVPVHSCLMLETREEALAFPRADIILGFCEQCGFITNVAFDATIEAYAANYEDQQSFSPTFNKFALDLAHRLIDRYDLHGKDIVEIGCSKGDFLLLLCELGDNRGVGIDPSAVPGRVQSEAADRVIFIQDFYSERHANYHSDLVCCRHTLEHIPQTAEFLNTVRRSLGGRLDTAVFFEVPDATRVLRELAFWDIYYEHCSYFSAGSLARLFRSCDFEVADLARAYSDQYLLIDALPVTARSDKEHAMEESREQMAQYVRYFSRHVGEKLREWRRLLEEAHSEGKRSAVWGSGSKCVAFLTTLDAAEYIDCIVDINPHRHGKFIPGIGKEIMPPESLKEYRPNQVIVMNSIYKNEIQNLLADMGIATRILAL